jgi:hypothetical protein
MLILHHATEAYSERREYFGLADQRRRVLVVIASCFLALLYWATGGATRHLRCHHGCSWGESDYSMRMYLEFSRRDKKFAEMD